MRFCASAQHPPCSGCSPPRSFHRGCAPASAKPRGCRARRPVLTNTALRGNIAPRVPSALLPLLLPQGRLWSSSPRLLSACLRSPLRSWAFTPSPSGWPWRRWKTSRGSSRATAPCPTSTSCTTTATWRPSGAPASRGRLPGRGLQGAGSLLGALAWEGWGCLP